MIDFTSEEKALIISAVRSFRRNSLYFDYDLNLAKNIIKKIKSENQSSTTQEEK